jgi:methyltransferase FkbM-like protein
MPTSGCRPCTSWRLDDEHGHPVPIVTLDTLLPEHGFYPVDVLKFDSEGGDRGE